MSWTDERVEKLQEMWAEGLSAAQIAKTLGGVTRNAVIGKVHRLGLSNRTTPGKPELEDEEAAAEAAETPDPVAPEPAPEPAAEVAPDPAPAALPAQRVAREPFRRDPPPISEERREALERLADVEKIARKLKLLELTERVCKWPIGDPTDPDFHFCGLPAAPGKPYCAAHVAVAFQPMSSRRDRDRQRVRS